MAGVEHAYAGRAVHSTHQKIAHPRWVGDLGAIGTCNFSNWNRTWENMYRERNPVHRACRVLCACMRGTAPRTVAIRCALHVITYCLRVSRLPPANRNRRRRRDADLASGSGDSIDSPLPEVKSADLARNRRKAGSDGATSRRRCTRWSDFGDSCYGVPDTSALQL